MKLLGEFKEFALKGNVMNLAVGVIIGAAFQSVITSLTENVLSPFVGLFTGVSLDDLSFTIWNAHIRYGAFFASVVNYVILAMVVFLIAKYGNRLLRLGKSKQDAPPAQSVCPYCKSAVHEQAVRCPACTSVIDRIS